MATSWIAAEWMEVPAAWDVVEPRATHNSCTMLEERARCKCLIMCGWGVAVLDFTGVFAPSMVFGGGGGLRGAKQTVFRSETYAGIQALRCAPRKNPKVLISNNEYFVSTTQKGRAHRGCRRTRVSRPQEGWSSGALPPLSSHHGNHTHTHHNTPQHTTTHHNNTTHTTQHTTHNTQHTKHKTQNTKHKTQNTKHKTQNTKHKTQNTEHRTQNTEHKTQNTEHKTQNTEHRTQNTEHTTQNTKYRTQNTEHKTQNKTQNTKHNTTQYTTQNTTKHNKTQRNATQYNNTQPTSHHRSHHYHHRRFTQVALFFEVTFT